MALFLIIILNTLMLFSLTVALVNTVLLFIVLWFALVLLLIVKPYVCYVVSCVLLFVCLSFSSRTSGLPVYYSIYVFDCLSCIFCPSFIIQDKFLKNCIFCSDFHCHTFNPRYFTKGNVCSKSGL